MARSTNSRQLAARAKAKLSGHTRSLLQKQISTYQSSPASKKSSSNGNKKTVVKNDGGSVSAMAKIAGQARRMTNMRHFQSANNALSQSKSESALRTQVGKIGGNGSSEPPTVDHELVKQNIARLGQSLYGVAVSPQVGPDGEIFFASEQKRYADVGYWHQGKATGRGETQTSFLLEPPFDETIVEVQSSTEYQPVAEAVPQSQPAGARVINMVTAPIPFASDVSASVYIGGVVTIPNGYTSITVTTTCTLQSSISIATDPNAALIGQSSSAAHYFQTAVEGPGFSPIPLNRYLEFKIGHYPYELHPVPVEQSISQSWNNLGHNHGEFLVMIGIGGLYHCFGLHSFVNAGLWLDVKSIQVDVA